jgi:hypothetical protein
MMSYAPQCEPLPDLLGVCTQIDNLIVGLRERASQLSTLAQERDALVQACMAHELYMLESGYSDPADIALHPRAAANWRLVRAALASVEGR